MPIPTPNTSSINCMTPYINRVAPLTIWALASSIAPIVNANPGSRATSGG